MRVRQRCAGLWDMIPFFGSRKLIARFDVFNRSLACAMFASERLEVRGDARYKRSLEEG